MLNLLVLIARTARNAMLLCFVAALLNHDHFVDARLDAAPLTNVRNWAYQLQRVDLTALAASPFDAVVVDPILVAKGMRPFVRSEIRRLVERPDGGRRLVLAYLSIGEAESYRHYWQAAWSTRPPPWLGAENPRWRRNYGVRFWDPEWQQLVVRGHRSLLDRLIEMGFDGVYLDRVDVFEDWLKERPTAREDMIAFVREIAAHARARRARFKIMVQNAEELLDDPSYLTIIDGIAKEDLLFGEKHEEEANSEEEIAVAAAQLAKARSAGKAVWAVEYLTAPEQRAAAARRLAGLGFVFTFPTRALDRLEAPQPPPTQN